MLLLILAMACTGGEATDDTGSTHDWDQDGHIDVAFGGDDCNDHQPRVYPGAPTICGDGIDNDCDGDAVEDEAFYLDADGDRFGDPDESERGCEAPAGYLQDNTDCDDGDATLNPNTVWYGDEDGDGFGDDDSATTSCTEPFADAVRTRGDCDDTDADTFPGAPAICDDGKLQDCGASDESDTCGAAVNVSLRGATVVLYGTTADEQLGTDVAFVGDLDRDGFDDYVVGAPRYEHGRAYVFYDHASGIVGPNQADAIIEEPRYNDSAVGRRVASLGDLDGDGRPDFAVAETGFSLDVVDVAGVALYEGAITGTNDMVDAPVRLVPRDIKDFLGWSMDGGVDISGDRTPDVVIGTPYRNGEGGAGRVYMLAGPINSGEYVLHPNSDADADVRGESAEDQAGVSCAILGDYNGDGDADLLVGAPQNDRGGSNAGAAYVVFGPLSGVMNLADADIILFGEAAGDHAGWAAAGPGDVDNDGRDDLLIGAPDHDGDGADSGAVYLIYSDSSRLRDLSDADERWVGESAGALAGYSLDGAGDLNGDDRADLLIGAPGLSRQGVISGGAYVLWGGSVGGRLADAPWRLMGENAYDTAGISVDGGGDWDGDGLPDLLIGAPGNDQNGLATGAAYLILGSDL